MASRLHVGVPETSKMCDDGVDLTLVWGLVWSLVSTFFTRLLCEYLHVDPVVRLHL